MNESPVADCNGLSFRYGETTALADVGFELRSGRVSALLGPNGAGKTTLIHLLLGLLPIQRGRIALFGEAATARAATRTRIGAMLQVGGVQDNLTVGELIALFASFYPEPASVEELRDECGLAGLEARRFDRLSGGQRQRVLFALAAVGNPDLLILDEPTTGLDPAARRRLWSAIEARRSRGTAILLSTHFMEEAEQLADRVHVLDRGRVRAVGTPDEIRRTVPRDTIRARTGLDLERLRGLPGVQRATVEGRVADLLSSDGTATLRALMDADAALEGIEVRGADLETAFLALTEREAA